MCRNIKQLYNYEPPATEEEIRASALQFIRKVSGFSKPSIANEIVFNRAVDEVSQIVGTLFDGLSTTAAPKNREEEREKARQRSLMRFPAANSRTT